MYNFAGVLDLAVLRAFAALFEIHVEGQSRSSFHQTKL